MLRVPVTAEERTLIEKKCDRWGTRYFSVYARKMLIDGYVIKIDYSDIKAMTAELQKTGTNINQIAKCVNATGEIYAQDIEFEKTRLWAMNKGNNLTHHLIQAFEPGEVDYEKAHTIGKQLADEIFGSSTSMSYPPT